MGLAGFNRARRRLDSEGDNTPSIHKYAKQREEEKFYCEECDRRFQNKQAYFMHMKKHVKEII